MMGVTRQTLPMGPGFFIFFQSPRKSGGADFGNPLIRKSLWGEDRILPRRIYLDTESVPEQEEIKDFEAEVVVDGIPYQLESGPPPTIKEALSQIPEHELEKKVIEITNNLKILKKEALKVIEHTIKMELQESEEVKSRLGMTDEALILILIASEV